MMNKQTSEQTEGDQSGVLITTLITLMPYCVYMHTQTGLTWVELFMDVITQLTRFLYTSLGAFIIETDRLRDTKTSDRKCIHDACMQDVHLHQVFLNQDYQSASLIGCIC